ncbi:GNAT family N-acetyltransferase [Candidatus Pacearchaeota archaeon]|nr:GNAT family N-acetyltransferase [Candidatus Pacearchaeota archaeon]
MNKPKLVGKRIILRKAIAKDIKDIVENAKDLAVAKYMYLPHPYKTKNAKKWVANQNKKDSYDFTITIKKTGKIIGGVGLFIDKKEKGRAEIGYWLGKKYWRQGYGKEAATLLIDFGFQKLKLHKITADVFIINRASQKLLEGLGFKKEGKLREHYKNRFGKGYFDAIPFGLLRKE